MLNNGLGLVLRQQSDYVYAANDTSTFCSLKKCMWFGDCVSILSEVKLRKTQKTVGEQDEELMQSFSSETRLLLNNFEICVSRAFLQKHLRATFVCPFIAYS